MLAAEPIQVEYQRLGVVLEPNGSDLEAEGVLNPAVARDRDGTLLMYPRMVAAGNVSRIGLCRGRESQGDVVFEREGIVFEPHAEYELRALPGGQGCEDPRVTYIPRLDTYAMAYTAFGTPGPRIVVAISKDGHAWERLGPLQFEDGRLTNVDNKDAAFFPEPVYSPDEILSFALYHRPMHPFSINGQTPIPIILSLEPDERESMCLAYIPVEPVLADIRNLRFAKESVNVLPVGAEWGRLKNGAGTPPVKTSAGWLSIFHAVDALEVDRGMTLAYSAGVVLHDLERPDRILYRSPAPLLGPETLDERFGIVNDVVFPTGIDPRGDGRYDVFYGAADAKISRARFTFRFQV